MNLNIDSFGSDTVDMERIITRLRMYSACSEAYTDPSQEGFVSGVQKLLIGVGDLLGKLTFTFKANTTRFYKDLKRSEITEFSESHLLKISKVENASFEVFMDQTVAGPSGMKTDYKTAIVALSNLYTALDIVPTLDQYNDAFSSVFRALVQESGAQESIITQLAATQAPKLPKATAAYRVFNDCFSKLDHNGMEKFSIAYKSMADFREVRTMLLNMEVQLQSIGGVYASLKDAESKIDAIISFLNKSNMPITPTFVKHLADEVGYLATLLDMTAVANTAQSALEHNHIVVINSLYNSVWPA